MSTIDTNHKNAGFTLIEVVVAMSLFGMLTMGVFQLFSTALDVQEVVTSSASQSGDSSRIFAEVGEDVRLSTETRVSESGEVLYVLSQENTVAIWEMTEEGLTNGSRTFDGVESVRFEKEGSLIGTTVTAADGSEESFTVGSRLPQPAEDKLTDTNLKAWGMDRS